MVGGNLLLDLGESRRGSSAVVGQFHQVSEVVLLDLEHDVRDQVHVNGGSACHLGDNAMETRPNDHDSALNIVSQGSGSSVKDIHCHRPAIELLNNNIDFSREADVL